MRPEIGRLNLKTWCIDKCLYAHALVSGASFSSALKGHHFSTVFTSCSWWRAEILPIQDSQLVRPGQELQKVSVPGHGSRLGHGNTCLA